MRQLLIIIVLAALGYFGWGYYQAHKDSLPSSIPFFGKSDDSATPSEMGTPGAPDAEPIPPFVSKVKVPDAPVGAKPMAPPGFFYMMDRVSAETPNGVIAIVPGDLVKLIQRKDHGKLRVTIDLPISDPRSSAANDSGKPPVTISQADFDVKEEQVTQDPEVAQVAEKRDFAKRYKRR